MHWGRSAVVVVALGALASADPAPHRVVVIDLDPELRHAIEVSLRPWRIKVVTTPDDTAEFVVSREGGELVVFDRQHATTERRPAPSGALDPVSAAESALTVKTMMRLPPPPPPREESSPTTPESGVVVAGPGAAAGGIAVRVQLGVGANAALDGDAGAVANGQLGVFVRPWAMRAWRFGVRGDVGSSTSIDSAGFKGTWRELAVIGVASWSYSISPSLELEPWAGAGVVRGVLDGTEMADARTESAVGARLAAGGIARWVRGAFSVGANLELDVSPGSPTYTKGTPGMGNPMIFQGSVLAAYVGVVAAFELGG